ncbi:DNA primase DnaG [Haloferax volcanii]|uniref:DNA primase DnaG n=3 Tax=Haloferax volcanii TaxID=2246 RepID=A0A384LCX5_HALVD|nr:DNA primase DnaG [Haloferax volcanii]ADE03838.1 DNA primase DnaG [Haloferax volcanii DS2]ELY33115.1 DNA primase [Haloferax volcanii DS2]MBS8120572.1 DNA primase [Haloferax volcanii]MBS8125609.1 DNA primase [Haloferax volcanii]MBS8129618.1 DNA primase [Haloferax volcanii]
MDDTSKYLIHASISADGVVERSDVVGAVFGQTEGLLGDELDLRDLQQSSKVGRIDVQIDSENGHSFGQMTIASSLDKAETAILAASLETLTRVGPCQAVIEVTNIEDVREAKRRMVVERAKELLAESFDDTVMSSTEILEAVKESVRVEDITEYQGLPAGPRVADSDAIIVVEGRADVLTLLRYGIKNAVAVEGTNVPDAVAGLTQERTVTAFLDGDRGGELILRELSQVGDVDYVAFAPDGRSVEDLDRASVVRALRNKVALSSLPDDGDGDFRAAVAAANGTGAGEAPTDPHTESPTTEASSTPPADGPINGSADAVTDPTAEGGNGGTVAVERPADAVSENPAADGDAADAEVFTESEVDAVTEAVDPADERPSLTDHVQAVIADESGMARLLNDGLDIDDEVAVEKVYDTVEYADPAPAIVVVDGEASQKLVDIAAQRGVGHVVARSAGEYVKKPVSVRVRTADQLLD